MVDANDDIAGGMWFNAPIVGPLVQKLIAVTDRPDKVRASLSTSRPMLADPW